MIKLNALSVALALALFPALPLADVGVLEKVKFVMKGGEVVKQ